MSDEHKQTGNDRGEQIAAKGRPRLPQDLHDWTHSPKSEPYRCSKCGGYYTDPKTPLVCPGVTAPQNAASNQESNCLF